MAAPLSPDDFDGLHDYIRQQVTAGYLPVDAIVDEAVDAFAGGERDGDSLRLAAAAIAAQAMASHAHDQAAWPEQTDCDRLDAAFAELDRSGILTRQNFSCCATCGAHEIHDELAQARKSGHTARGYTFFHRQDTEHAVIGDPLYLSYGAADSDRSVAVAIGHEVVETLIRHGLSPAWNGKFAHRIELQLAWQRRRSPSSPSI